MISKSGATKETRNGLLEVAAAYARQGLSFARHAVAVTGDDSELDRTAKKEGYVARFYPAWENYPTGDVETDVRRMNAFIEERVREMPEQYFWAHKRFKTRPPGERSPYEDR